MITSLVNTYAVPFGYTSDIDSEMNWTGDDDLGVFMTAGMDCHSYRSPNGIPPLPDLIRSHTPPSSPLRRAHSYHFFPEKGEGTQERLSLSALQRSLSALPTPPPTPNSPEGEQRMLVDRDPSPVTSCGCEGNCCSSQREDDREVDGVRTGLEHIQEVRRSLGEPPAHFQPHQSLPELTWEVPAIRRSRRAELHATPHAPGEGDEGKGAEEGNTQEGSDNRGGEGGGGKGGVNGGVNGDNELEDRQQRLRQIGNDLRRIADQFQDDNGRVSPQKGDNSRRAWSVPAAFGRCLSVSFLCLVWWRVMNKMD